MSTRSQEEFPPPEAFVSRGTCHWCGRKRVKIATWMPTGTSLVGKTQICRKCAEIDR